MSKQLVAMVFTVAILLAGCASKPTPQDLASADYGTYPSDYEEIVKKYMDMRLKDPDSARYEFINSPKTGWNSWGGRKYGYIVCALVNAKNSYGGYTGSQIYYFMIKNGRVIDSQEKSMAQAFCKSAI